MPITTRLTLAAALADFTTRPLPDAATAFWKTLGYESNLTLTDLDTSPDQFARSFGIEDAFRPERALTAQWQSVHFLFQLSSDQIAARVSLFGSEPELARSDSYLFFAIDLVPGTYQRGPLAQMARELNRPFASPILVLFRNGARLTLAVVDRRPNKTDAAKDVLEKVTLIKDIDVAHPHAAHIRILEELELSRLRVTTWDALHKAWRAVLDLSELNKSFYRELSNWYFWARTVAAFPAAATENDRSVAVIRLITRAMFVYFIKERGLVPSVFFDPNELPDLLIDTSLNVGTYYNAILQNLFFAALNAEPAARGWQGETKTFQGKNESYLDSTKRRGKELFQDPDKITKLFDEVPFLNGGLFECLDSEAKDGKPEVRHDGFSSNPKKRAVVPNYLFWGAAKSVDLNDIYQTKNKTYSVRPLLEILNRYKFTVTENLPLEEEVALDPELLGKVFENLLASYNPETATTARKQTGSFYTPREIVDYMVAESVVAYLETACADCGLTDAGLRALVSYETDAPPLTPAQRVSLIAAVGRITILDPACGSGAFPMGCLHRLTHLLKRLDDDGALWKAEQQRQIDALDIADVREAAQERFNEAVARDNGDYVRKLYLIERSLFGVDIQPIAVQISKLRFFISLVIEQKLDPVDPARGVQPLPNLETKIVAANTLIRPGQGNISLTSDKSAALEKKLSEVRRKHFSAREWSKKKKLREQDAELRAELAKELKADGMDPAAADQMAAWNPYDQNQFAPFFDKEWMFGPYLKSGFNIVIGNPPYGFHQIHSDLDKEYFRANYQVASGSFEHSLLFYECGLKLITKSGCLAYIAPVTWLTIPSALPFRKMVLTNFSLNEIAWFNGEVFDQASVNTLVSIIRGKNINNLNVKFFDRLDSFPSNPIQTTIFDTKVLIKNNYYIGIFDSGTDSQIIERIVKISKPLDYYATPCSGYNPYEVGKGVAPEGGPHTKRTVAEKPYHSTTRVSTDWLPEVGGKDLQRYHIAHRTDRWIKYGYWLAAARDPKNFVGKRILVQEITGGRERRIIAAYCDFELYHSRDIIPIKISGEFPHQFYLLAVINSDLMTWYHNRRSPKAKKGLFPKVLVSDLKNIPVRVLYRNKPDDLSIHSRIIKLVGDIIAAKTKDSTANISDMDDQINKIVYQLYGISADEQLLIASSFQE